MFPVEYLEKFVHLRTIDQSSHINVAIFSHKRDVHPEKEFP